MVALLFCIAACKEKKAPVVSNCSAARYSAIPLHISTGQPLNLYLDSMLVTGVQTPIQYLEKEDMLLVLDTYAKRLLWYPLHSPGPLSRPVQEHALHISEKVMYMHYINRDTLLLYTYGLFRLSYYSLAKDTVYKTLSFYDKKIKPGFAFNPAPPNAGPTAPIIVKNNLLIGIGYLMGEHDSEVPAGRTLLSIVHLPGGGIQYKVPYSPVYKTGNWGGSHMRTPYAAYNAQEDKLVLSLPADHLVQVIDSSWQVQQVYAGSGQKICITSMPVPKNSP